MMSKASQEYFSQWLQPFNHLDCVYYNIIMYTIGTESLTETLAFGWEAWMISMEAPQNRIL